MTSSSYSPFLSSTGETVMHTMLHPSSPSATLRYLAPECVRHGTMSSASDVYAFGVVLLELITGWKAMDESQPRDRQRLLDRVRPEGVDLWRGRFCPKWWFLKQVKAGDRVGGLMLQ